MAICALEASVIGLPLLCPWSLHPTEVGTNPTAVRGGHREVQEPDKEVQQEVKELQEMGFAPFLKIGCDFSSFFSQRA